MNNQQNIFQTNKPEQQSWNSQPTFADTASNITPEQKDHAFDLIDNLIESTKQHLLSEKD